MNLVQINERLKEMPLQAVQQYANGMNPEIPPYLALGELQRRETMHKQAATAQGAANGPQPSVKEQIEQKAGLMALQQQQARQAQQQMMQPRPGPVPENVPQPPEQPQEVAMASGGIARLPVRLGMFDFASGGIVAFDGETNGSYVDRFGSEKKLSKEELAKLEEELRMRKLGEAVRSGELNRPKPRPMELTDMDMLNIPGMEAGTTYADALKALEPKAAPAKEPAPAPAPRPAVKAEPYTGPQQYTLQQQGEDWVKRKQAAHEAEKNQPESEMMRAVKTPFRALGEGLAKLYSSRGAEPTPIGAADQDLGAEIMRVAGQPKSGLAAALDYSNEGRNAPAVKPAANAAAKPSPMGNVPTARSTVPPSVAPAVAANAAKQEAAPAEASIPGLNDPSFIEAAKRAMAEPSQEQGIRDHKARMAAMGLGEPYGKDQEARINALNAQYQKGLEDRGLERLMRVLQARNMGEYGSRYLGAVEQERAADLAQAAKMNELLSSLEGKRREEGMTGVKTVGEEIEKRRGTAAQTAASLGGHQMQANVSRANQLSQNATSLKIAELDRTLREKLHNTPAAQKQTIEEQAIKDYVDAGYTRTQAFEKVKTIAAGLKGEMTVDQARDNVRKDLENPMLGGKLQADAVAALKARGVANPTSLQVMDYLVEQQMKGSKRATGTSGSATLPAGFKLD